MYKFFLTNDKAPKGFYVGPYFSYAIGTFKNANKSSDHVKALKMNVAAILGYQIITKGGFALDIFTGLGFKKLTYSDSTTGTSFDMSNLTGKNVANVNFGFNFGYAF